MKRLLAIIFIYLCTTLAWMILGSTILVRTNTQEDKLKGAVGQLWGTVQRQQAPTVCYETKRAIEEKQVERNSTITRIKTETVVNYVPLQSSQINVSLSLRQRQKGLLWYSTYAVSFASRYAVINDSSETRELFFHFKFPAEGAVYDEFRFAVGGRVIDRLPMASGGLSRAIRLPPGGSETVEISYKSQGLDQWFYDFGSDVTQVRDFLLTMTTDFGQIDFPRDTISPTTRQAAKDGWELKWQYSNLLTGVKLGMDLPHRLNPGPWVSQVTFSAPISLFLFFFLLFIFTTLREVRLHPMNYFFIGAGFFGFHLLLAYSVDLISIHFAFLMSSTVSILLVVSYMRLVVGKRFAYIEIALAQFIYLVLFSYTFFFEGYTGLAITLLCLLTLFVVMQFTGKVNWEVVFAKRQSPA